MLFVVFLHELYISHYQENRSDRITFFFKAVACVPDHCFFYSSAYLFIPFPPAPWLHRSPADRPPPAWCPSSRRPPGRRHQTPPCLTSLPLVFLTVAAHPGPHWPRSLPFSDPLSPSCPLAIPPLPPLALLPVPCPHCCSPLPWSKGSRQSS